MKRHGGFDRCVMLWLFALVLTACFGSNITQESIVGVWHEQRSANIQNGNSCSVFQFSPDGRFQAHAIPQDYFVNSDAESKRVDVKGTWMLDSPSPDPFLPRRIDLKFDPFDGYTHGFDTKIYLRAKPPTLFAWKGDESNQISFAKDAKCD